MNGWGDTMIKRPDVAALDVNAIRKDFPVLHQQVNDCPLIYLDNAATTQKPAQVIEAMNHYYRHDNANVHRGVHALSARATLQFETARAKVARFINAPHESECIFVRGTTEAINLVATSFVAPQLSPGDEILITHMEHHANIVPWQMLCQRTGAILHIAPITLDGELILEQFERKINKNTKFISITHVSNALGSINPVKKMIEIAHAHGVKVLVDGAQAAPHLQIDVQALGCDFYAFSGHKMYAPTGIGVLWGREKLLENMPPYQGGGEMINSVTFEQTEYAPLPYKFEAGTPNIAGVIGLGAAIDYLSTLDMEEIAAYEAHLLNYATALLQSIKGFTIMGCAKEKVPVLAFVHARIHAHDIGTLLDNEGIAIRSGHHCAMPLMSLFQVSASTRISLAFYNTTDEIDRCMNVLRNITEVFV